MVKFYVSNTITKGKLSLFKAPTSAKKVRSGIMCAIAHKLSFALQNDKRARIAHMRS